MKRLLLAILIALGAGGAQAALTFDAYSDFSSTTNQNGVWGYGGSLDPAAYSFVLNNHTAGITSAPFYAPSSQYQNDSTVWYQNGPNQDAFPAIWSASSSIFLSGTAVYLHPGHNYLASPGNWDQAVLRFTAPSAGNYSMSGSFYAGDGGQQNGSIVLNSDTSSPLFYVVDTTDSSGFSITNLSLGQGETLDFVVGANASNPYGAYSNIGGTTPLNVQITVNPVPLPAAAWLMLSGIGVLGAAARRKSSRAR
jgi:hypothetical protein